jgi:hypothetical protein
MAPPGLYLFKNRFVMTSTWVSQRSGQSGLTKNQVFGIQILGKGVIIGEGSCCQNWHKERNGKAPPKWVLRKFLAMMAGQKLRFPANFYFLGGVFSNGPPISTD